MITTKILAFSKLNIHELYALLALRAEVFVIEQNCIYQDLDYKDQNAEHLLAYENDKLIGYARILPFGKDDSMSFGRLIVTSSYRGKGIAKQLMDVILGHLQTHHPEKRIIITAQHYLQAFYKTYGFEVNGAPFDLDGIPHVLMVSHR